MIDINEATTYLNSNAELLNALEIDPNRHLTLEPLGKGEHNKNFVFSCPQTGKKYVLRVNVLPQPFHTNQVRYEYNALKALEASGCVPRAYYIDDSPSKLAYGVLVIEFSEGEMLDFDNLRPGDLQCAAQLMANIHATELPQTHHIHKPQDEVHGLFDECVGRFEYYLKSGYEDDRITRWMQRYLDASKSALDTTCFAEDCSHIINTETLASHFLIPKASADQAAKASKTNTSHFCDHPGTFVDWERPIVGEVAQDLAFFVAPTSTYWDSDFLFPRQDIDAFLNDYWRAVDGRFQQGNFEERFWAYFKLSLLRSAMWCCKAIARYKTSSAHHNEKTFGKLPIYLSDEFNERIFDEFF